MHLSGGHPRKLTSMEAAGLNSLPTRTVIIRAFNKIIFLMFLRANFLLLPRDGHLEGNFFKGVPYVRKLITTNSKGV